MYSLDDEATLREVIIDHYEYPRNKKTVRDETYYKTHEEATSCIDDIWVFIKFNGDEIQDIAFDGIGCAISMAATSVMTELLKGKSLVEAKKIIAEYGAMIDEQEFDATVLKEGLAFHNVYKQPNRIKCAKIGWDGAKKLIDRYEKDHEK